MKGKIDRDEFMRLHAQGLNDTQLAKHFGVTQSGVTRWRWRNKVQPNQPHPNGFGRLSADQKRKIRKLLRQGATREQVMHETGCGIRAVQKYRRELAADPRLRKSTDCLSFMRDRLRNSAAEILQELREATRYISDPAMRDDVVGDMTLALFEGRLQRERIKAEVRAYSGRVFRRWHSVYGPCSIDEEISGEGLRLGDLLACPSSSAWLEQVGA